MISQCLVLAVSAAFLSGCGWRDQLRSASPKGDAVIAVQTKQSGLADLAVRVVVRNGSEEHVVFRSENDWGPVKWEVAWSDDGENVGLFLCNPYQPLPVVFGINVHAKPPDQNDSARKRVIANAQSHAERITGTRLPASELCAVFFDESSWRPRRPSTRR